MSTVQLPGFSTFLNQASCTVLKSFSCPTYGHIGRTDFPKGDHAALIASIRHKLFPLGDDIAFVPGHGPMSTFGRERRGNPYVGDDV